MRSERPAEDFSVLQIPADATEFTIKSDPSPGVDRMIIVDVPYGGRSQPRSLHIIRVPENEGDDVWVIDPNSVEAMQDWRTISREQAGFLKQPEKIRLAGHAAASKLRSGGWLFPLVAGVFLGFVLSAVFSRIRRPISVVPPEQ